MKALIGAALIIVALSGALSWQISTNGELSAANVQLTQDVADSQQQIADITARRAQDNQQIAEARNRYEQISKDAQALRDQLRSSNDVCINTRIGSNTAERVRSDRDKHKNNKREGSSYLDSGS